MKLYPLLSLSVFEKNYNALNINNFLFKTDLKHILKIFKDLNNVAMNMVTSLNCNQSYSANSVY